MPQGKDLFKYINTRDNGAYTVFLLPSTRADIKAVCYDYRCREVGMSYGAIIAAALFLVFFRGLPLDEVEIEICDRKICVSTNIKERKISLNLPKCKEKLENIKVFVGNIEADAITMKLDKSKVSLIAAECKDAEMFENSHLFLLLLSDINNDVAIAFSFDNSEITVKYQSLVPLPDLALFSAIAAYECLDQTSYREVKIIGESIGLVSSYSGIRVTLNAPPMMCFTTPYL